MIKRLVVKSITGNLFKVLIPMAIVIIVDILVSLPNNIDIVLYVVLFGIITYSASDSSAEENKKKSIIVDVAVGVMGMISLIVLCILHFNMFEQISSGWLIEILFSVAFVVPVIKGCKNIKIND